MSKERQIIITRKKQKVQYFGRQNQQQKMYGEKKNNLIKET